MDCGEADRRGSAASDLGSEGEEDAVSRKGRGSRGKATTRLAAGDQRQGAHTLALGELAAIRPRHPWSITLTSLGMSQIPEAFPTPPPPHPRPLPIPCLLPTPLNKG